jgi:hypothetical protein
MDELFSNLESYLDGSASLDDFKDYFYDLAYGIGRRRAGDIVVRVHEIERIFSEASSANWTERAVQRVLKNFIDAYKPAPHIWKIELDARPLLIVPTPQMVVVVPSI